MNKYPISPYLSIYKLPLAAVLSISYRISFVILMISIICIILKLSKNNYLGQLILQNQIVTGIFILNMIFHVLNLIRHFIWGLNYGLNLKFVKITNIAIIVLSIIGFLYFVFSVR